MTNTGYIKFNTKDITTVIQEETADKISVNEQTLTDEQKVQARKNINAVSLESDGCKSFPDEQQVDYNTLLEPGFYSIQNVQSLNGPGFAAKVMVLALKGRTIYYTQVAYPVLSDINITCIRSSHDNGSTWSSWQPIFSTQTIINPDYNTLTKTGFYHCNQVGATNGPGNWATKTIVMEVNGYITQFCIPVRRNQGSCYYRVYDNTDEQANWTDWVPCFNGGTITSNINIKTANTPAIILSSTDIDINETPVNDKFETIRFIDKNDKTLGFIQSATRQGNIRQTQLAVLNDTNTKTANISITYDRTNDKFVSYAPTPPATDNSEQIATTRWVYRGFLPNYGGMISANDGNTTASLYNYFPHNSSSIPNYSFFANGLTKGSLPDGANTSARVYLYDGKKNAQEVDAFSGLKLGVDADGTTYASLITFKNEDGTNLYSTIAIKTLMDGTVHTQAPTPPINDNSEQIATTAFVVSKIDSKVNTSGNRGNLAGYENTLELTSLSVTQDTQDSVYYNSTSAITCNDGTAGTSWIKVVTLGQVPSSVTLGSSWAWVGGSAPTLVANGTLVFSWQNTRGLANFLSPS